MKLLSTIIFLIFYNLLFAQDTLKNNFPTYFISQIEIRYEFIDFGKIKTNSLDIEKYNAFSGLHQPIKLFSPNEFPPYFDLNLSEEDVFEYKSGFEMEPMEYFWKAENNNLELTSEDHYPNSAWIISTNFDTKESANFNYKWTSKNVSWLKNQVSVLSLFYQKEKFLRSVFEWDLNSDSRKLHFNISYINNSLYQHESNTAIGYGNRRYVYFPKKYHEQRASDWVHTNEIQNQNISGLAVFPKLLLSPFKKTYLKIESDFYLLFLSNATRKRRRFRTVGIGTKPIDGTIIFLEYTNRRIGFDQLSSFLNFEEKPYFSLYAKRILKLRLIKNKNKAKTTF